MKVNFLALTGITYLSVHPSDMFLNLHDKMIAILLVKLFPKAKDILLNYSEKQLEKSWERFSCITTLFTVVILFLNKND